MKNNFDRTKTETSKLGTRSLALLMFFVMLFTAIGSGSVLSALAVTKSDDAAAVETVDEASVEPADDIADEPATEEIPAYEYDTEEALLGRKSDSDLAATGANVDIAASGSSLETGARIYFNAHGAFSSTKKYVYIAWIWNTDYNYTIIRLQHIANTEWYTEVTSSSNIVTGGRTDVSNILFFTTDASGWATTTTYRSGKDCYSNITNNVDGYVDLNNNSLFHCYNNHVYYCNSGGCIEDRDGGDYLANDSGTLSTKSGQQKASVYVSTDGSTYSSRSTAGEGGEVRVGGYGWSTAFVTTAQTFASASSDDQSYSYFDNAVRTSYITMEVTDVYDGWYFQGWYDGDTLKESGTTYTYQLTSTAKNANDTKDIHARFLKPTYSTSTPASTSGTISSGTLLMDNVGDYTGRAWVYKFGSGTDSGNNYSWNLTTANISGTTIYYISNSTYATQASSDTYYKANPITTDYAPYVILTKGTSQTDLHTWPGDGSQSSTISEKTSANNSTAIYYYKFDQSSGWENFSHISASVAADDTEYDLGEVVQLSATLDGTFSSGATLNYYYTTDGGAKDDTSYKLIATTTDTSIDFYPPANGSYQFLVTAADTAGIETVRSSLSSPIAVGGVGYYVAGNTALTGTNWTKFSSKGAMTNDSGTHWTKTFSAVAAGTHEFRITDITQTIGSEGWTSASDYTLTGNGVTLSTNGNNVQFTLAAKSKVTITFDSTKDANNKYPVTVTVQDVVAVPVTVYAGSNGSVTVTYGSATTEIDGGDNTTIYVAEGESIDLLAEPDEGYSFNKWAKNLSNPYQIEGSNAGASISGETITKKTIYVAYFSAGSGDLGFDDSGYSTVTNVSLKYSSGTGGDSYTGSSGTDISGTIKQNGNNYWIELSSSDLTAWINGASSGAVRWNMFNSGSSSMLTDKNGTTIDSTSYASGVTTKMDNYGDNVFVELSGLSSSTTALGLLVNPTSKTITYYTSTSSGSSGDDYVPTVNFYAKDTIYYMSNGSPYEVNYMGDIDTTVTEVEDEIDVTEQGAAWEAGTMLKGCNITVTTTIPTTGSLTATNSSGTNVTVTPAQKYYVVGFSFNGYTPEILEENNTGVYTCTYTIPADMSEEMLEITPIFFIRDEYAGNTVKFYLNGYEDLKSQGWGNTLFVYPYYRRYTDGSTGDTTYKGQAENFGGYPGQPVVNNGGQLYTQVPLTNNGTTNGTDAVENPIKGVTINNGYFDKVHQDYCGFVSVHKQTYDYDDFAKIYYEKNASGLHAINFSFKFHAENESYQHRAYNTTSTTNSKSRYNDMYATTGTHHSLGATTTSSALASYVTDENPWEDLTDSLGNKVDLFGNSVDTSKNTVYVVSMGYEYNNSGEYATEWAIYTTTDGTNYSLVTSSGIDTTNTGDAYNSSIVPSALVMNSADSFDDYTVMDGDQSIAGYEQMYTDLTAYAGAPVKIVYEYDAYINYNNPHAYRSDGRWTYTTNKDYVRSNIEIQYKGKGAPAYTTDTFTNTNEGTSSGCKAYFTNSDYYGAVTSTSELISNTAYYNFTAETAGSYVFAGWYLKDVSGKESPITTTSLSAKSLRSGNYTFIARFDYVANGTLTISNALDSASAGRGTTYLGVTLIYGGQETVRASVNSNTEPVTLDSSIIKSNSAYQIKIDLRTVPSGENTFDEFNCYTTNGSGDNDVRSQVTTANNIYDPADKNSSTASYTITVSSDLYSNGDQVVKAIEYISSLNAVQYDYSIKFNYNSRQYGAQAFTKTGTLSPAQIADTNVVTGTSGAADKKLTKTFLQKIAPHESNFNTEISWNFDTLYSAQTCTYDSSTNTYTITATATSAVETANVTRNGYFTVPYELSSASGDNGIALATNDKFTKADEDQTFTITLNYDELFYDSNGNFVTAPTVIYETVNNVETARYFKYWEMSTVTGSRGESRVVGKCYFPEFNYRALENYNITAVYTTDDAEDANITENAYATLYEDGESTTVSFIGNSRNQWNSSDSGTNVNSAGDLIYNDFIFSFKPEGSELFKDISGAQCGMIIQRLKEIEKNSSGKNAKTLQQYAKDYSADDLSAAKDAATAKVGGTSTSGYSQSKVQFNASGVNDKNRMHYAFSMYNSKNGTATTNAQYLYRAYSYMTYTKDGESTTVVSEEPAYFYMYDIANE